MKVKDKEIEMKELVWDLYWDYDRMSFCGKKTLDNIANLVGISPIRKDDYNE